MKLYAAYAFTLLATLTGGHAALAAQEAEDFQPPELLRPISVNIPPGIEHLVHPEDMATIRLRLDATGRVVDWVPLELPHYRLEGPLGVALSDARFQPAIENGQPVSVDLIGVLNIGQGGRIGVQSMTVSDFMQGRLDYMGVRQNKLLACSPDELDEPLKLVRRGEAMAVKTESGELLTGQVWVEFFVDSDGQPRMIRPENSGQPALEQAAMLTVKAFRFNPPKCQGSPTVVKARILVVFS